MWVASVSMCRKRCLCKDDVSLLLNGHCGCIETCKGTRAAILRGMLPLQSGNPSNPQQPEPPNICSRFSYLTGARGGPGGNSILVAPRRLCAAFDARKRLPGNRECDCLGGMRVWVDDPSTHESGHRETWNAISKKPSSAEEGFYVSYSACTAYILMYSSSSLKGMGLPIR